MRQYVDQRGWIHVVPNAEEERPTLRASIVTFLVSLLLLGAFVFMLGGAP